MRRLVRILITACASASVCLAAGSPAISAIRNLAGASVAVAGDVIDILGSNLAAANSAATGWPIPTAAGATTVSCGGFPAPILSAAPDRLRIQLPWELAGLASTQLQVTVATQAGAPFAIDLAAFAPAILAIDTPEVSPGQTVTLRVTGLGARSLNPPTGSGPSSDAPGAVFFRFLVLVGGVPAPVLKSQLADTGDVQADAGVQVISVQLPSNAPAGSEIPVAIQINGVASDPFPLTVDPGDVRVTVTPPMADVPLSGSLKFQSSVEGSGDSSLKWSIDPNSYQLPNNSGFYGSFQGSVFSASSSMSDPNWTIVRATHASGAFATAVVRLVAPDTTVYRIVPGNPVLAAGETVTFTLLGPGDSPVDGVTWSISDGFGNVATAAYTAPLSFPPTQVNVWASLPFSNGFRYQVASTTILIAPPRTQVTGTSPRFGHIGESLTLQGTGVSARVTHVWFTAADGSRIRVAGSDATVTVPHGAVSGPSWLELSNGAGATFLSAPFPLTLLPRLRLHPSRLRVSSGETIPIAAAAPDIPGPWPLTWRADVGFVDSKGMFQAPAVTQSTFARIWACLQPNVECGTTVVEVVPFRLEPDPLILNPGEKAALKAWQGSGPITVAWQAVTANVTVSPDGTLTAGAGPLDGGSALVSATFGGVAQNLEVSIRTAGAVARTAEFSDWLGSDNNSPNGRLALGVFATTVKVNGDWLYALSRSFRLGNYGGPWLATWLDVYHLDARRNPVWVDAVAAPYIAAIDQGSLYLEGANLYVIGQEGGNQQTYNILLRYDVSAGRPVPLGSQVFDGNPNAYRHQGMGFSVVPDNPQDASKQISLQIVDYSTGVARSLALNYKPLYDRYQAHAAGSPGWAAVSFYYPFNQSGNYYETVIFDTTGDTAQPFTILPGGGDLTALPNALLIGADVYRVSGQDVTLTAQLPTSFVLDSDPATQRLLMTPTSFQQSEGYRVIDLSDPSHPKISAPVFNPSSTNFGAALGPDYVALVGGPENVGVSPISWTSGLRRTDSFPASPFMNDLRIRDGFLYWTGSGFGYSGRSTARDLFEIVDVSTTPSRVVATLDRPLDEIGYAIELNGHYAYVGTDSELLVYDVAAPGAPALAAVIPAPAISLALAGKYLYAGSNTGKSRVLLIYDVSNPAGPRQVASLALPDFAYGLTAQPGWLVVALGGQGIQIFSLANPASPTPLAQIYGTFWGVAASGSLLYGAADSTGLMIYDLTQPRTPVLLSASSLAVGDESAYFFPTAISVAYDSRGIAWLCAARAGKAYGFDVRTPRQPRPVVILGGAGCENTAVSGSQLFLAGNDAAFDVSNPQNVGLYFVSQTQPGLVLPDRFADTPPFAAANLQDQAPPRARAFELRWPR